MANTPQEDASDDVPIPFHVSEDLVQSPTHKAASTTAIDFDGLLQPPLVLHEDLRQGNGGQAWPAGMVMAKYLLRKKRDELRDASIVELGAGGGLVGLALALAGQPQRLDLTDQASMVPLMQQNLVLNNLSSSTSVTASAYPWGEPRPESIPRHPDIVLAADCVYFEPAFPLLLATLEELLAGGRNGGTVGYICFKRRRRADLGFLKEARKRFEVVDVTDDPDREEGWGRENIYFFTIRKKKQTR